ncbi:MAG TPA: type II toxin-antitoxin system Phd/YefM family antitoxin [Acidimicrobiales bacterium]|nr:type II toxin-antitoxin system Phd/YefM family antitoxin [Acidimicrobiales bacterium]
MSIAENLPLAEVKNRLSEVVAEVEAQHGRVVITKHGRPAAVLMAVEDLESLEETLAILSDPEAMADLEEARRDIAAGRVTTLTKEEALARWGRGG